MVTCSTCRTGTAAESTSGRIVVDIDSPLGDGPAPIPNARHLPAPVGSAKDFREVVGGAGWLLCVAHSTFLFLGECAATALTRSLLTMISSRLLRAVAAAGASAVVCLVGVTSASAAAPAVPKPTASCKVPVLSVSQTTAKPGTKITVSGQNFSGCSAQSNPAKPTGVLTVQVGIFTAAKVKDVLATTKTSATGSFSVQITVPKVSAGGKPQIAVAAQSTDPVTKLSYTGFRSINYTNSTAPSTTAAPTPTSSSTASPTSTATGTAEPTSTASSVEPASTSSSAELPTAVPAGSGGSGAPTSSAQLATELGIGAAGAALVALGGFGVARRRAHQH